MTFVSRHSQVIPLGSNDTIIALANITHQTTAQRIKSQWLPLQQLQFRLHCYQGIALLATNTPQSTRITEQTKGNVDKTSVRILTRCNADQDNASTFTFAISATPLTQKWFARPPELMGISYNHFKTVLAQVIPTKWVNQVTRPCWWFNKMYTSITRQYSELQH